LRDDGFNLKPAVIKALHLFGLSLNWLFFAVIQRNSAFTFQDSSAWAEQIGQTEFKDLFVRGRSRCVACAGSARSLYGSAGKFELSCFSR